MNDKEIFEAASSGDSEAFAVLYEKYAPILYRYVKRLTEHSSLTEDIVHDVFLKCVMSRKEIYREDFSAAIYLCVAARHLLYRVISELKPECNLQEYLENTPMIFVSEPEKYFKKIETQQMIEKIMRDLPFLQKEAIILFELEGFNLAEVAIMTKSDVGTVKSRLKRARDHLKRAAQSLQEVHPSAATPV